MGTVVTVELSREAGEKLMAKFNAGECPELEAMGVTKMQVSKTLTTTKQTKQDLVAKCSELERENALLKECLQRERETGSELIKALVEWNKFWDSVKDKLVNRV